MKKVIAISSTGGHWIQLHRATQSIDYAQVIYCTPYSFPAELSTQQEHYQVEDFNRDNLKKAFKSFAILRGIFVRIKPDVVITTGAAPGLLALLLGRLMNAKCYWIDSIANSEKISLSGQLSRFLAHQTFTQWEHLSTRNIKYIGKVV